MKAAHHHDQTQRLSEPERLTLRAMDTESSPAVGQIPSKARTEVPGCPSTATSPGFPGFNPRQRAVLAEAPVSARGTLERAYSGKSKAAGIKALCLWCVGYVRNDVRDCTSYGCPLHPYRPFQQDDESHDAE